MIKDHLNRLNSEEKRQIMYAFEHQFSQRIFLDGKKFIGVHIQPSKNIKVIESAGVWTYGEVIGKERV